MHKTLLKSSLKPTLPTMSQHISNLQLFTLSQDMKGMNAPTSCGIQNAEIENQSINK